MTLRYKYTELFRKDNLVKRRLYRILQDLDGRAPGGAETDPIFAASPAAGITPADIARWNSGTGTETDPVFSASPAASITSADLAKIKTSYESRISTLESQIASLQDTVSRLDASLSSYIESGG